jgi:hypothetical protein
LKTLTFANRAFSKRGGAPPSLLTTFNEFIFRLGKGNRGPFGKMDRSVYGIMIKWPNEIKAFRATDAVNSTYLIPVSWEGRVRSNVPKPKSRTDVASGPNCECVQSCEMFKI